MVFKILTQHPTSILKINNVFNTCYYTDICKQIIVFKGILRQSILYIIVYYYVT